MTSPAAVAVADSVEPPALTALRRVREILRAHGPSKARTKWIVLIDGVIALVTAAPAAQRARLCAASIVAHGIHLNPGHDGPLCPSYPKVNGPRAARLALGAAPAEVVLPGLTPREAHECLAVGCDDDPIGWLLRHVVAVGGPREAHDLATARWVLAVWADDARRQALLAHREEHGLGGVVVRGRFADRVDEIREVDLARGERTSVRDAFASAAKRAYERWAAEAVTRHEPLAAEPEWWGRARVRCARILMSAAELVAEGKDMDHCVGTYAHVVREGRGVVLSLCVRDAHTGDVHRSTAEISRGGSRVVQHKGRANGAPPLLCDAALSVIMARIARGGA